MKSSDLSTLCQFNTDKSDTNGKASSFADRIRYFRTVNNMTQLQLAEMLGVTKNTISNWESGRRRPELDMVPALCTALRITFDEFYGSKDPITSDDKKLIFQYHALNPSNQNLASKMMDAMLDAQSEKL